MRYINAAVIIGTVKLSKGSIGPSVNASTIVPSAEATMALVTMADRVKEIAGDMLSTANPTMVPKNPKVNMIKEPSKLLSDQG